MIELKQTKELLIEKYQIHRSKVKYAFDKIIKENEFKVDDLVLRWDSRREENGKHGKFDNLWFGYFMIVEVLNNNIFVLKKMDDNELSGGPSNGRFVNHFYIY